MTRQVILDTETTGLEPSAGHRVIEIGCVELINRKLTGQRFHVYLNPERDIDPGAVAVHGLSLEFLADKPRFADIVDDLLDFLRECELIIHNAPFDLAFLNQELALIAQSPLTASARCSVTDTLILARQKHPGQRNSLDALCKRYGIDNSQRERHGALLDAEILAEVYLAMTGGQIALVLEEAEPSEASFEAGERVFVRPENLGPLPVIAPSPEEITHHQRRLAEIQRASQGKCLWLRHSSPSEFSP